MQSLIENFFYEALETAQAEYFGRLRGIESVDMDDYAALQTGNPLIRVWVRAKRMAQRKPSL